MRSGARLATVILLALIAGLGCDSWRGPGFRPHGPEMPRLREVLMLGPSTRVADIGAGGGEVTVALALEVGPSGHVFSTDIDPNALAQIRSRVATAGLKNVTVVHAQPHDTGLPMSCCDALLLRRVYHHLSDPAAMNVGLLRALRPGGVLAIIDFPPTLSWLWPWPPKGVPTNRNGHGVAAHLVVDEVTASGFELVKVIDDWPGRGPLENYCAVFRKPAAADGLPVPPRSGPGRPDPRSRADNRVQEDRGMGATQKYSVIDPATGNLDRRIFSDQAVYDQERLRPGDGADLRPRVADEAFPDLRLTSRDLLG